MTTSFYNSSKQIGLFLNVKEAMVLIKIDKHCSMSLFLG